MVCAGLLPDDPIMEQAMGSCQGGSPERRIFCPALSKRGGRTYGFNRPILKGTVLY
jgi:hypothetical protein